VQSFAQPRRTVRVRAVTLREADTRTLCRLMEILLQSKSALPAEFLLPRTKPVSFRWLCLLKLSAVHIVRFSCLKRLYLFRRLQRKCARHVSRRRDTCLDIEIYYNHSITSRSVAHVRHTHALRAGSRPAGNRASTPHRRTARSARSATAGSLTTAARPTS
jgi:hypothetical protein